MTHNSDRPLLEIPVPFPDPFICHQCYNPKAPDSMRKQGVFNTNSRYTRHLRNIHAINTARDVSYYCSVCQFKGTVKHIKAHGCPGPSARLDLPSTGPCELLPRLDTAPHPDPSETPAVSSTTRVRRAVALSSRPIVDLSYDSYFEDRRTPDPGPDLFIAALDSVMEHFDGSKPLDLGPVFHSWRLDSRAPTSVGPSRRSCPPRFNISSDEDVHFVAPMASTPASEARVPLFAPSVTSFPVRGLFQAVEPSIHVSPLLQPPARDNVPSLNKLCISFINRGLALAASQSPPASPTAAPPSPDLPATPFGKNVVGAIPVVVDAPLVPVRPAPAPPVLHPLASGVSGNTPSMSASFKCHFCDHFSKTQKGLNHHLVRAHRYGVAPRERRVAFSSPLASSHCESVSAIPSGFPDSALGPDSAVVAPAPSDPLPSADATFVISPVKLSSFQQEWIRRCREAAPDSIDDLARSLADSILKRPPSSRRSRGRRDRRRPSQQPPTPAVESVTPHSNISRLRYDPAEASKLQRAYRVSPKKTLDRILGGASPFCAIPQEQIVAHFSEVFSKRDTPDDFPFPSYSSSTADELLSAPFVPSEIWDKLGHLSDSAPGPDGIRYSNHKSKDPGGHLLTVLFNLVLSSGRVPMSWKNSRVVLIHKKGDLHNISNWRPISLLSTMGKVFSSVLAARLSSWANINNRLSPFQKGFRESEGCVEHNFILEQAIFNAKRSRSDLALAWLDLENAFGSIPHSFIFKSLHAVGVPSSVSNIILSLYTGASSEIRCGAGWTPPISMEAGVRQGCPLSAILFNLSLEQVLRPALEVDTEGYLLFDKPLRCLAYADDLVLIDKSRESLQILLDSLVHTAARIGLRFKPPPPNALPSRSIMRGALAL
ncbi:retrovirus-related Pol polyprotein from type-2 retrotransposable element R2DM [Trichonephila clavata]|uniref:Retrovirus-related Pol polyprotein from type-2 retrotransposable element R2DM n=1 Tax=Trichonephila clavata TaxID=2740835 RepID=A0A8X6K5Z4_TRICU|nr:retrovirus-related Pol polyprotein from type-2 retrotransposable element R2DM [Trichonephila clavata]